MDIQKELARIQLQLEAHEEATNPEERMDLKQTISQNIALVKKEIAQLDEDTQLELQDVLEEFAEILEY